MGIAFDDVRQQTFYEITIKLGSSKEGKINDSSLPIIVRKYSRSLVDRESGREKKSKNNDERAANNKQCSKQDFHRNNFVQEHYREKNCQRNTQLIDRSHL